MKACRKCGETKPLEDFPPRSRKQARDGRYSYCRPCNRILAAERQQRWRKRNPDKVRQHNREYQAANPNYTREWYERNLEKERARSRKVMRELRKTRPELGHAARRRYRAKNAEVVKARERENTYARRAKAPYSPDLAEFMAELVTQPCAYCGATEDITVDHIVPLSRGGKHEAENLAPACISCNSSKCNRLLSEWSGRAA